MITVLLIIILLLVLYVAYIVEQVRAQNNSVITLHTDNPKQVSAVKDGLNYEWDEEWPKWSEDAPRNNAWVPYENPKPYLSEDAFTIALLKAEIAATADAREIRRFLKRLYQIKGSYLPIEVCDLILGHPDVLVRAWAASHISLIHKDYAALNKKTKETLSDALKEAAIVRDYRTILQNDSEAVVRAAIFCNPNDNEFIGWLGVASGWQEKLSRLSQLERLALMRNPDLGASFVVAMMKTSPAELNIAEDDYTKMIAAAVLNSNVIERSRRQGRGWHLVFDDGNPPMEEFAEMWELAATTWLEKNPVPYTIFSFIQTKASVKLDIYRRLGDENKWLRDAILKGCEPREDAELLQLGLNDADTTISMTAAERCGDHLERIRKLKPRS